MWLLVQLAQLFLGKSKSMFLLNRTVLHIIATLMFWVVKALHRENC